MANMRLAVLLLGLISYAVADQAAIGQSVWTSTATNGTVFPVTITVIDGVTISASPAATTDSAIATPWVSLDGSGIPYEITPSIVTPGGSTVSASPTPTESNYPTPEAIPPVLQCFGDRVPAPAGDDVGGDGTNEAPGYPFCTGLNGTEWLIDETYWITWDPTYWGGSEGSIPYVKLYGRSLPTKENEDVLFETDWVPNSNGYYPLKVDSSYRNADTAGYFFLDMDPQVPSDSDAVNVGTVSGPILRIITSRSEAITEISRVPSDNSADSTTSATPSATSTSSSSGGISAGNLAAAIVVPIVVVGLVGAFVYYWFFVRRRAIASFSVGKRASKGYGGGSKAQRMGVSPAQPERNPFDESSVIELDSVRTSH